MISDGKKHLFESLFAIIEDLVRVDYEESL